MESIRISSTTPSTIRKWNQFSQLKALAIQKTSVGYILTMYQEFKRGSK